MSERELPDDPTAIDLPYVPVPPDPARDARVAARRAADARRAGAALDNMERGWNPARELAESAYSEGWRDGYEASQLHHNRHYGVSDDDGDPDRDTGAGLRLMRERGLLP